MQEISNSLNAERLSGYWQQLLGIVGTSQGGGGGILKKKFWLCLCWSVAQSPMFFFRHYSLFHQDAPCNPSWILFILGPASITMFLMHFVTLCRKCLRKTGTVVSCSMKCRSERMSGLIRNLTAYYLSRRSTKPDMLKQFLEEVLEACQNVGLRIVAHCLWHGYQQRQGHKTVGFTRGEPYIQFQNQAIATIYDPPHLLKCTRNIFLKYDVQFESELLDS